MIAFDLVAEADDLIDLITGVMTGVTYGTLDES